MNILYGWKSSVGCLLIAVLLAGAVGGCGKQAKKERALARAQRDFSSQNYDRAEIEYLTVLRIPPPDPSALLQLGRIYYAQGKFPKAFSLLQKASEVDPGNADVHARLAMTFLALSKFKEAREQALLALDKQPQNVDALLTLTETTHTTHQIPETLKRLDMVPPADKSGPGYHLALGNLHLRMREWDKAESDFKAALVLDPKSSQAYLGLGSLYLAQSNVVQAEGALKSAADLAPLRSGAPLKYAELKLKTGSTDEARKIVERVVTVTPDYLPARMFLAQMEFNDRKTDACRELLDDVLTRDPYNFEGLLLKGNLLLGNSDPTNALTQFARLEEVYGKMDVIQYKMALARLQTRETSKAMNLLNEILTRNPGYPDAVMLRASLQIRNGEPGAALGPLSELVRQQPQLYQAQGLLAEAFLGRNEVERAINVYSNMCVLFPASVEVPVALGSLQMQLGRRAEARENLQRALNITPDNLAVIEKLADLDMADGKSADALARVRGLVTRNPQAPEPLLLTSKIHIALALEKAGITNAEGMSERLSARLAENADSQKEVSEAEQSLLKAIELKPDLRTPYLMLAQLYVRTGRQSQALEKLSPLAKTNDLGALIEIGNIHTDLKNYQAARDAYEAALRINPELPTVLNNLAYLYTELLGQIDKGYDLAVKARSILPESPQTADTLGWVLYRKGEYEKALPLLQQGAAKLAQDVEAQFHLGSAYYMLGQEIPAEAALRRAMAGENEFAWKGEAKKRLAMLDLDLATTNASRVTELQNTLATNKNDPIALIRLGMLQEQAGNLTQARDSYEAVLQRLPRNSRIQFRLGNLYARKLGDPAKGLELVKQAYAISPDDAEIKYALGKLVFEKGEHAWALSLFQDAVRKLSDRPEPFWDLAWAWYSMGRTAEAETAMQEALQKVAPEKAEAGRTFLKMLSAAKGGDAEIRSTSAEAKDAVQKDPNYVPGLVVLAAASELAGDFAGARDSYEKILRIYPNFSPAMKNLSALYAFRLGNLDRAYEWAAKAREALPQDHEAARTLGIVSFQKADNDRAVQLLSETLRTRPEDAEAHFYMGMAQYRRKQRGESSRELQRALELKLDSKLALQAKETLQELNKNL